MAPATLVSGTVQGATEAGAGTPKQWCFRCGTSRGESEALLGGKMPPPPPYKGDGKGKGWGKGAANVPPREQSHPGRTPMGPQFSTAPTFSEAKARKRSRPAASEAQVSQSDILSHLVRLLADIGCNQETLDRVQAKVDQVKTVTKPVPEEKERMLYVLKAKLDKAAGHLEHLRSVASQKEMAYMKANEDVSAQEVLVRDLNSQHEQARLKVMIGSNAGSDTGEQQQGPEIEWEQDMSDIDPDLAPAEWDLANSNGAAASSSACADFLGQPPPPPSGSDCVARPSSLRRTWSKPLASVQQMQVWCQERLDGIIDGSTPSG